MHKCPQRHTEEGRRFGQATETSLWRLSEIPPGSSAKDKQHLPALGELGCLGPRSPSLAWMLRATIVPEAAHGSDGAAPAQSQSHLETSWAGCPGRRRPAPPRTDRPPACAGTKAGAGMSATTRGQRGPSERSGVATNHRAAPPSPAPERRHQQPHLLFPTHLRPTNISHDTAGLAEHAAALGRLLRTRRPLFPTARHFFHAAVCHPRPLGANGSRYKSAAKERSAPCQPRCRGLCSATRAGGCDTPILPGGILPCPAPGRAESTPQACCTGCGVISLLIWQKCDEFDCHAMVLLLRLGAHPTGTRRV